METPLPNRFPRFPHQALWESFVRRSSMAVITKNRLLALCILGTSIGASAHGVVESPPSRNWICGEVTKPSDTQFGTPKYPICGEAYKVDPMAGYNFMSVVTHTLGRSAVTPLPKNVCG